VTEDMKIMQEEIFGPVCSISKFKTKDEVIRLGNATTYGLAAAVHTSNLNTAIEVSNQLRAGTVWVNTYNTLHHQMPFGGYKESGLGKIFQMNASYRGGVLTRLQDVSLARPRLTTIFRPRLFQSGWVMPSSVERLLMEEECFHVISLPRCYEEFHVQMKSIKVDESNTFLRLESRFMSSRRSFERSIEHVSAAIQYSSSNRTLTSGQRRPWGRRF
jgi:hypothetical protein